MEENTTELLKGLDEYRYLKIEELGNSLSNSNLNKISIILVLKSHDRYMNLQNELSKLCDENYKKTDLLSPTEITNIFFEGTKNGFAWYCSIDEFIDKLKISRATVKPITFDELVKNYHLVVDSDVQRVFSLQEKQTFKDIVVIV